MSASNFYFTRNVQQALRGGSSVQAILSVSWGARGLSSVYMLMGPGSSNLLQGGQLGALYQSHREDRGWRRGYKMTNKQGEGNE
jgi:hypothetical protein